LNRVLTGKETAKKILNEANALICENSLKPALAAIIFGGDESCLLYAQSKTKIGESVGIKVDTICFDEVLDTNSAIEKIAELGNGEKYHGIILEEPLPKGMDTAQVRDAIPPEKDVDCATSANLGKILSSCGFFEPATPLAVLELLVFHSIDISGKNVVIVGRSRTVGLPLANMLLQKKSGRNATVTVCHSGTRNLAGITRRAEILIVAIGSPSFIGREHVSEGTIVVDVGTNFYEGRLVGDVDFESVKDIAGAITPVPGGVGPVTVACLMRNTAKACILTKKK